MDPTAYSTCLFLGNSYAFSTGLESKNCKELGHYFFTVALDVQCIERKIFHQNIFIIYNINYLAPHIKIYTYIYCIWIYIYICHMFNILYYLYSLLLYCILLKTLAPLVKVQLDLMKAVRCRPAGGKYVLKVTFLTMHPRAWDHRRFLCLAISFPITSMGLVYLPTWMINGCF